jgi:RNA-directed DNA polymerase
MKFLQALVAWLRRLFGAGPVERSVARLPAHGGTGRAPDVLKEVVRLEGPFKPNHRRLITRDARLLPHKPRPRGMGRRKIIEAGEAKRLFASTLRTRNRDLRTLAIDEAQLTRFGLPLWKNEEDVATALGLTVKQLRHFSTHRNRERVSHYVAFAIPKRNGGERIIHAPKKRLKRVLRMLHALLVCKLPAHTAAHGFIKGRSVKTNAQVHVGHAVVVKLDVKDFFPTVSFARVRGLLVSLGYGYPVAATLAALMTESTRQLVALDGEVFHVPVGPRVCVQGAPTSPGLCNAVVRKMDARLSGLARKHGFVYSRYADDMAFSGDDMRAIDTLIARAHRIIVSEGFALNVQKTKVMRRGSHQVIAGVTVNADLGLSRKQRRRLRAEIHRERTKGLSQTAQVALTGKLAWVEMLNPEQAAKLRARRRQGT